MSTDNFAQRHIGIREKDIAEMLGAIGVNTIDELIDQTLPEDIRMHKRIGTGFGMSEYDYLRKIREMGQKNQVFRSFIGMGYYNTAVLSVVKRNILENPSWYTSYTPYQAEISQGRLEALLNFQTVVMELTGMEIANASLLDESTAAAEAMIMLFNSRSRKAMKEGRVKFFIDEKTFPQTLVVLEGRAKPLGIELIKGDYTKVNLDQSYFGAMMQYPNSEGSVVSYRDFVSTCHEKEIFVGVIADILSLVMLVPPGEWGADVVTGSTQRFGIPPGYGGPHAGYFATRESFKRNIPGRIIGVSVDRLNNKALRMALQTREQHIKRERATSNICTAQALLATMAGMYAVYHGPEGLKRIAGHVHSAALRLNFSLKSMGYTVVNSDFFDTLTIRLPEGTDAGRLIELLANRKINIRIDSGEQVGISADETMGDEDISAILDCFAEAAGKKVSVDFDEEAVIPEDLRRRSDFLVQDVFHAYRSETEIMRYMKKLERKDFSLTHSMISLGSCTMKLNAASELMAFMWPEFADIHPFVPGAQAEGYHILFEELKEDLKKITGFSDISFQPNSGAAGEYTGLMVIRAYHQSRKDTNRNVVLIPSSAHGTNPASAIMAGMKVVIVKCDENGNVDVRNLKELAEGHRESLAAFMITYPSTHGVFEEEIRDMVKIIHDNGGQVYMDGANMNAQVGLTSPGLIGADVCHLNLHKTFAIPHGGGGPGVGPIGVAEHLAEFLPGHPLVETLSPSSIHSVSASPYGSASILTISHAYIKMLGDDGLTQSTKMAILNANYLAACLGDVYQVLYKGNSGRVGHEMILECRDFKSLAGITESDIAKRLIDYGFHAPTLSFPVHGTLMVEPTESESLPELKRFVSAMKAIFKEIRDVSEGIADKDDNVLKNAPHTSIECVSDNWAHEYSRQTAAYPAGWVAENKFWPAVARVDDAYGDRNLVCSCLPVDAYKDTASV